MSKKTLERLASLMARKGVNVKQLECLLEGDASKKPKLHIVEAPTKCEFKFAVVSDTHLCDKACALAELHAFYNRCVKEGVKYVLHCGDLTSGVGTVYKGQINDLAIIGFDEQVKFVVENYPKREGITTYFISGNHDLDALSSVGSDICQAIADKRPDMVYLGKYDATVQLHGVFIGIHHGAGGASYAQSYKLQKYAEKIGAGQKPHFYFCGHWHGSLYMFYRNIHCFLPGCFQKPTDLSVRLGLPNTIGAWILEVEVADDRKHTIKKLVSKFIPFP